MKTLTIEITDRCSLNCLHCSTNSKNKGDAFVSLEEFKRYLDEFPEFEVIRLSGGEPFEHPHLDEILKEIKKRGKRVIVMSCGVSDSKEISEKALSRVKNYTDSVMFSVYGREDFHNSFCGKACFDTLRKSVENTAKQNIMFSFQTVVMNGSVKNLEDIFKHLSELKQKGCQESIELRVIRFIRQGRGRDNSHLAISEKEMDNFISLAKELSIKYGINVVFECSLLGESCSAGTGKMAITIQGDKISCSALKYGAKQGRFACRERW